MDFIDTDGFVVVPAVWQKRIANDAFALLYAGYRLVTVQPSDQSAASCLQACSSNSAFCLKDELTGSQAAGLKALHDLLLGSPSEISRREMLNLFDVDEDPCNRGTSTFQNDAFANAGDDCTVTAPIEDAGNSVSIAIPTRLEGTLARSGRLLEARFTGVSPELALSDPALNNDWGGLIVGAFSDGTNFGVLLDNENSCIMVALGG